jgi:hypothetical protein
VQSVDGEGGDGVAGEYPPADEGGDGEGVDAVADKVRAGGAVGEDAARGEQGAQDGAGAEVAAAAVLTQSEEGEGEGEGQGNFREGEDGAGGEQNFPRLAEFFELQGEEMGDGGLWGWGWVDARSFPEHCKWYCRGDLGLADQLIDSAVRHGLENLEFVAEQAVFQIEGAEEIDDAVHGGDVLSAAGFFLGDEGLEQGFERAAQVGCVDAGLADEVFVDADVEGPFGGGSVVAHGGAPCAGCAQVYTWGLEGLQFLVAPARSEKAKRLPPLWVKCRRRGLAGKMAVRAARIRPRADVRRQAGPGDHPREKSKAQASNFFVTFLPRSVSKAVNVSEQKIFLRSQFVNLIGVSFWLNLHEKIK